MSAPAALFEVPGGNRYDRAGTHIMVTQPSGATHVLDTQKSLVVDMSEGLMVALIPVATLHGERAAVAEQPAFIFTVARATGMKVKLPFLLQQMIDAYDPELVEKET